MNERNTVMLTVATGQGRRANLEEDEIQKVLSMSGDNNIREHYIHIIT